MTGTHHHISVSLGYLATTGLRRLLSRECSQETGMSMQHTKLEAEV
jgi:hypothetical protein